MSQICSLFIYFLLPLQGSVQVLKIFYSHFNCPSFCYSLQCCTQDFFSTAALQENCHRFTLTAYSLPRSVDAYWSPPLTYSSTARYSTVLYDTKFLPTLRNLPQPSAVKLLPQPASPSLTPILHKEYLRFLTKRVPKVQT